MKKLLLLILIICLPASSNICQFCPNSGGSGSGSGGGVTSLNGMTGPQTIAAGQGISVSSGGGTTTITNTDTGAADPFTQYFLLAGRSGGQIGNGGTAAADNLDLRSTASSSKGYVKIADGSSLALGNLANSAIAHYGTSVSYPVVIDSTNSQAGLNIESVKTTASTTSSANIGMASARGSYAAPISLNANDFLGSFQFRVFNGTNITGKTAAELRVTASDNHDSSVGYNPTNIDFVTSNSATPSAEKMQLRVDSFGDWLMGYAPISATQTNALECASDGNCVLGNNDPEIPGTNSFYSGWFSHFVNFDQISTPATNPATSANKLYFKSDDNLYSLNSGGVETLINGGGGATAVTTIGPIDGITPSVNGLAINGSSLYAQSASPTRPGLVNLTTQVFNGNKTFNSNVTIGGSLVLSNQPTNTVFAGPVSGSSLTPNFRRLVNADLPQTGVTPASYTSANITVNAQGVITAAANGSAGASGVTTMALLDGIPASATQGAVINGASLYMQSAASTIPGLVNTTTQTFAGNKTYNNTVTLNGTQSATNDAATIGYVNTVASGLDIEPACVAATTANLTATYVNLTGTLTNAGSLQAFAIDGYSPAASSRVLIKNQTSTFQNGIYTVTTVGNGAVAWVLTRATNYDQAPSEIGPGDLVVIENGTVNAITSWLQTATVTTIGTDPILWSQFTGQNLTGPTSSVDGDISTWSGTSGKALRDETTLSIAPASGTLIKTSSGSSVFQITGGQTTIGANGGSLVALVINGGVNYTTRSIGSSLTIDTTSSDYFIFTTNSTIPAPYTVTLPAPTNGRTLIIKDNGASLSSITPITIARNNASNRIDGIASNLTMITPYTTLRFVGSNGNWLLW